MELSSAMGGTAAIHGSPKARMKVCLAASGGGHIRQLLDLEPAWSPHDYFFVSEDTALSRSIGEKHRTRFVPHFALGQARLGKPVRMAVGALKNLVASGKLMLEERPDVLITTGAGAVFFSVVWARLLGAKIVVIESFARFHAPSVFGRMAARFAHEKVVQSKGLASYWPDAKVLDPLRELDGQRPEKQPFLFATVGAILPFDRLVGMVSDAKTRGAIPERVIIQTGVGAAAQVDPSIETVETLPFDKMQECLRDADIVVCHGGTGSLITALRQGCRVVAVPRLFECGEVYDDHQLEITNAFAARGYLAVAKNADELVEALDAVRARPPAMATSDPSALVEHLHGLFDVWRTGSRKAGARAA